MIAVRLEQPGNPAGGYELLGLAVDDRHFLMEETVDLEKLIVVRGNPGDRVDEVGASLAPVDRVTGRPVHEDRVHPGKPGQPIETFDAENAAGRRRGLELEKPADPGTRDQAVQHDPLTKGDAHRELEERHAARLEQHLGDASPEAAVHLDHLRTTLGHLYLGVAVTAAHPESAQRVR